MRDQGHLDPDPDECSQAAARPQMPADVLAALDAAELDGSAGD